MKFLDQAKIFLKSGDGGDGCVSFCREKCRPKGGPDGGNGGTGGHIVLRVIKDLNTLIDYRYRQHFKATKGGGGQGKSKSGAKGQTVYLDVPPGTQVWDAEKKTLLTEIMEGEETLLAGGRGGLGSESFKSSTNRSPRFAQKGEGGQEMWVWLQLKLLADVGLVGLPNAGKSTLLAALTKARPKIADYPFTTIRPNLGTVLEPETSFVIADIPGLIEGAHQGKGLGQRFLGHVERCGLLLHVLSAGSKDVIKDYETVQQEIKLYGMGVVDKESLVVLNKTDLLPEEEVVEKKKEVEQHTSLPVFCCSAIMKGKLDDLLTHIQKKLYPA
jgi:GTP-binding protein